MRLLLVASKSTPMCNDRVKRINNKMKRNLFLLKEFKKEERFFCNPNSHIYDKESCKIIWNHIETLEKKNRSLQYNKLLIEDEDSIPPSQPKN